MPYPPRYQPKVDFALVEQSGEQVSGAQLATELANVAETVAQVIGFIRAGFTSDRRWQPAGALAQEIVKSERSVATAGQNTVPYPLGTTVDPAQDFVRVFVDGVLLDPDEVTVTPTLAGLATPLTGGEVVVLEILNDYAAFQGQLASVLAGAGASLVGLEDALGQYVADNAEDAFAEVMNKLDALVAALGDLSKYGLITGTRAWEAAQSMGGNRITDLAAGIDATDAVNMSQLTALAEIFGNLSDVFLALAGGTMQGPLNMNGQALSGLPAGVSASSAVNKSQLDAAVADAVAGIGDAYLPLTGGTLTGVVAGVAGVDAADLITKGQLDAAIAQAAQANSPSMRWQVFDTSGTFTVPAGVGAITAIAIGGGGGGATRNTGIEPTGGGAGGSGGLGMATWPVAPGEAIAVTIGAGGAAGASTPSNGSAGGTSSITPPTGPYYLEATGGGGGFTTGQGGGGGGGTGTGQSVLTRPGASGGAGVYDPATIRGEPGAATVAPLLLSAAGQGGRGGDGVGGMQAGQPGLAIIVWWETV